MTARRLATVDVGTNTTLLLVAEESPTGEPRVLAERAEITRLGRGIGGDGRLGREGIERTLAVLREYGQTAHALGAPVRAIGTEALRHAPNSAEFLAPAREALGGPVEVIDGEREAALSHLAACRSFPEEAAGTMVVIDIGGGSTEVIVSERGAVRLRTSLPIGSVRLTERHVRTDPPTVAELASLRADVRATLDAVSLPQGAALVGTAGTVTTLAAMAQRLASYDPALVHGFRLTAGALATECERLERSTQADRERMPGLDPRRADVITAGAVLLREIARRAGVDAVLVSDRGIRWGLLYEGLDPRPPP